jgi:hypothetical protein
VCTNVRVPILHRDMGADACRWNNRSKFQQIYFDRNSKLIDTPLKKVKRVNSVITEVIFSGVRFMEETYCRVFPSNATRNCVGLGFGRIFIERSLFTLTNTIIRTYNVFGRFLFSVIHAPLISVKCLLLCSELNCP